MSYNSKHIEELERDVRVLMGQLEAERARVAELEAQCTSLRVNNRVLEADNADLLERARAANAKDREEAVRRLVLKDHQAADQYQGYMAAAEEDLERAESEAAALRAEVERLKAAPPWYGASLAAANALLREATEERDAWNERRDAHLTGQAPAPTELDAAERKVLEACKTVEHASLEYYVKTFGDETGWGAVSAAELARREAERG